MDAFRRARMVWAHIVIAMPAKPSFVLVGTYPDIQALSLLPLSPLDGIYDLKHKTQKSYFKGKSF